MILFELLNTENNALYSELEVSNGNRQYDFLKSIVETAIKADQAFLSQHVIKALNYHAIACLHTNAGEYRPCPVTVGTYRPPEHYRVQALMDQFVNNVNRIWTSTDPVVLATYALWRLNYIHPFINGNGRTARAACYFILCVQLGGWPITDTILPELLRRERTRYVAALSMVDQSFEAGDLDLTPLHSLVAELLNEQQSGVASNSEDQDVEVPPDALSPQAQI